LPARPYIQRQVNDPVKITKKGS